MAKLTMRLHFSEGRALGPGKVRLLELVAQEGSISAAGRTMRMSYRRAWLLIDELNRAFREPLVTTRPGGQGGGGAALTALGREVVTRYRTLEALAATTGAEEIAALAATLKSEADA